jgi:hypothetical protein
LHLPPRAAGAFLRSGPLGPRLSHPDDAQSPPPCLAHEEKPHETPAMLAARSRPPLPSPRRRSLLAAGSSHGRPSSARPSPAPPPCPPLIIPLLYQIL